MTPTKPSKWWRGLIFAAVAVAFAVLMILDWPPTIRAEPVCAPAETIVASLTKRYAETLRGAAINGSHIIEIYTNDKTGTLSIVKYSPSLGLRCLIDVGKGFRWVEPNPPSPHKASHGIL